MNSPIYFLEPTPAAASSFFRALQRLPRWLYGLIGVVAFLALSTGLAVFVVGPLMASVPLPGDPATQEGVRLILVFAPYWLMLAIYAIAVRSFRGTGFTRHHAVRHLLLGLLLGLAFNLIAGVVPGVLLGETRLDTDVFSSSAFWMGALLYLAAAFVQGGGEEVLFRGLMPRFLGRALSAGMVTMMSTVTFAVAHGFVPNALMTIIFSFIVGAVFGLIEILTNSAWLTVGFHTTYNFVSLFCLGSAGLITGTPGVAGVVGTLGVPVVAVIVLLVVLNKRRPGWFRERIAAPVAAQPALVDA